MSLHKIALSIHSLSLTCITLRETPRRILPKVRWYSTVKNADNPERKKSRFRFLLRHWLWSVPIGVCVTLFGVRQWKYLHEHPHPVDSRTVKSPISDLVIECYCCLPLRVTSRIFGWLASVKIPESARPVFYNLYAKTFNADLQDIDDELCAFPSLVEFFVRRLKETARPIDPHTNIVSPADGRVLYCGTVTSCRVEQVKGITYNLRHFLEGVSSVASPTLSMTEKCDDYVTSLLKNPNNRLYQLTIYLAPGDYHRFHSPTDWRVNYRKHFQGKLLSVNPKIASWLPDLFAMNERVVYTGEWAGGFMAYAAIGATNVGSIKVYLDHELATNQRKWPVTKTSDDANLEGVWVRKGEVFGEFRMGSTIVMLFEAPPSFSFALASGQHIKVGEAFARSSKCFDGRSKERNNFDEAITHAVKLITNVHSHGSQERQISLSSELQ